MAQKIADVIVMTKSGVWRIRGHWRPRPPAEMPSCVIRIA